MSWVLIVGASSGIGRAVAHRWAAAGNDLLLAGRDTQDLNHSAADLAIRYRIRAEVCQFDALDFKAHQAFWQDYLSRAGGTLEGVIIVHGSLPVQEEAQKDLELLHRTIDTNYTSAASLLTLAANEFESRRAGFICVFTSVAGDRGRQSNYVYGSAKAGLSAFTQGLRNRLFKSNVTIVTVKPGFVDSAMTWGLPGMFLVAQPDRIANDAFKAVRKRRSEIYSPWFWRYIMLVIKLIPDVIFKRMRL
jgi:short-subunit dehydrogenase